MALALKDEMLKASWETSKKRRRCEEKSLATWKLSLCFVCHILYGDNKMLDARLCVVLDRESVCVCCISGESVTSM
jgi:hypothetical protein